MYTAIVKSKHDNMFYWSDLEVKEDAEYYLNNERYSNWWVTSSEYDSGTHMCKRSVLYDDMSEYVDCMQKEDSLRDDELYVVAYHMWDEENYDLGQYVDFGITKQEIIDNVKSQKYREGATYYTMGQMLYATNEYLVDNKYDWS